MKELFILSTPIGNLKDITLRAVEVLKEADVILCESPFKMRKLLHALKIQGKKFFTYREEPYFFKKIFKQLENKKCVFITSAGTPLISDPGFGLVDEAFKRKIKVTPIPGVSALTTILSACPLKMKEFAFLGFLPRSEGKIKKTISKFLDLKIPVVVFLSKRQIKKLGKVLVNFYKEAKIFVAREMTKAYEEFLLFKNPIAFEKWSEGEILGEITMVILPK